MRTETFVFLAAFLHAAAAFMPDGSAKSEVNYVFDIDADTSVAYYDPLLGGGEMLAYFSGNDLGEPLNVIISGLSSPEVLTESGFLTFARSIHFSKECLGIHLGGPAAANLGDGNGPVNQTVEYRYDYDDIALGTCLETLIGGNHLRIYNQNGSLADSGALFLAVSVEEDLEEGHTVMPNGYDLGRNRLAESAVGTHKYDGKTYTTTAENITGLLEAGSTGINHDISIDGIVTLLTIELS